MFRFFSILVQIILLLTVVLIAINYSFIISIEIQDYIYSISSNYFLIGFLIFFFVIFLIQSFYFKLKFNLSKYSVNKVIKNKQKGYDSFLSGMIALANKDYKKAILESKKTSNYLKDNPSLSLLLKSEIYKIEKKYDELNQIYEDMSKNEDTENLAYRGLMEQYLKAQDYHHAFIYGEKLFNKNPYVEKIYDTLLNILAKTNNWQQLLNITNKAYSKKIINKIIFQENKSIALYEIAKVKQHSEVKESLNYIQKALTLRKKFPPYIKLYLDILIENKDFKFAKKILKKAWNDNPHSEYKSAISNLAKNLDKDVFELTRDIVGNKQTEESKILLVESSISSKKWDEARNQIKVLLDVQPKKEVCILMAKIEEGDSNDIQKKNSWMLRSKNGAEKKVWICMISNKIQSKWTSLSDGGYFNSLEWKQPNMLSEKNLNYKTLFYEN